MSIKTPLARARGLGSARSGVAHFWAERATAVALVPLVIWFLASLVRHAGADHDAVRSFFAQPLAAALMLLLVVTGLYHMKLGIQVIVEDYIHNEGTKLALLLLNTFFAATIGLVCVLAVLKLTLVG